MSKVNEVLNDLDQKCSLCGTTFPFLPVENQFTGEKYCSEQCMNTDGMIAKADYEENR